VYAVVEATPGVFAVTVTRFRRQDSIDIDIAAELQRLNLPSLDQLPDFLRQAIISVDVPSGGRIDIGDFEIPALGELVVTVKEVTQ